MLFVTLESKGQTCIPFPIPYNICEQQTHCLTYSLYHEDSGEVEIRKDIINGPFNNAEQNTSLKNSIVCVLGNSRLVGGGDGYHPFTSGSLKGY